MQVIEARVSHHPEEDWVGITGSRIDARNGIVVFTACMLPGTGILWAKENLPGVKIISVHGTVEEVVQEAS